MSFKRFKKLKYQWSELVCLFQDATPTRTDQTVSYTADTVSMKNPVTWIPVNARTAAYPALRGNSAKIVRTHAKLCLITAYYQFNNFKIDYLPSVSITT